MCGLVGVASAASINNGDWLLEGRDVLEHRGPDAAGCHWSSDRRVGLAHRRLSIVDLSELGQQPMAMSNGSLSVIFNGEIYNHKDLRDELTALGFAFRSHSDTEVLLAAYDAWGVDCLRKFNGMFAFALHDVHDNSVFIARDRAGEKPLFYRLSNRTLQFASELKALLKNPENPRDIDLESLDCYLGLGYVPGDRCMLRGYNKLPAAHAMRFDLQQGALRIWRYWSLPELDAEENVGDETALLEELEYLAEDAVARQMVADVPVGVLLSGGVDSSVVTALAARSSDTVHTYSIGFARHHKYDETAHARLVANHFGTRHTELFAEDASVELLPELARQYDEPIVDSSMIPTFLVSKLVRRHCTVALGGDGADELFGGYPHHDRLLWMRSRLGRLPLPIRQMIAMIGSKALPIGYKGRNWVQSLGQDLRLGLPLIAACLDAPTRGALLMNRADWKPVAETVWANAIPQTPDLLQRSTRMDFTHYLCEDILVKVDRASMLSSLELRSPFLDYRLVEFAFRKIPSYLKATETDRKILLKRLAARLLPPDFDLHRKQGFSIPLGAWLKSGAYGKFFRDVLLDAGCSFDAGTVNKLLAGQDLGRNNGERLFALVLFELWKKEYAVKL